MEPQYPYPPMLDVLLRPAFYVQNGHITQLNQAAAAYLLEPGQDIAPLLCSGQEEYQALKEGCLCLTLCISSQKLEATIIATAQQQLFILEQRTAASELQALSLAARELRTPLTGLVAAASQLVASEANARPLRQINHRIHQLMRIVSNMSDAAYYCESAGVQMEYVQLCAFLEELLIKSQEQLQSANIHLKYSLPSEPIYTLADTDKLERAVYNLISNAAKHTAPGGSFTVSLSRQKRLYLSVTDDGYNCSSGNYADVYCRYLRVPSITDGSDGIGLGMVLVRAAAAVHNGTVLIQRTENQGTRITMTLELRHGKLPQIRSPLFYPDYAGERDHGLQELSDILPATLYDQEI